MRRLRRSEMVLIAFFLYAPAAAIGMGVARSTIAVMVAWNAGVIGAMLLLAHADTFRRGAHWGVLRDWYSLPLMLLAYREMGWFAQPHANTALEESWVVWDRLLLNQWGLRALIESLGPVIPGVLEIAYMLVYAIGPFSLAVLYVSKRRDAVDSFLFTFLLGVLAAEALFPFFPSEPPRTVFPGADMPSINSVFRGFNHWYLGHWGIHTSVFPSAHVSGAFAASFAMLRVLPEKPWAGRVLLALALLIATSTVYGRYHYLVDAIAGLFVAGAAHGASVLVYRKGASPPD